MSCERDYYKKSGESQYHNRQIKRREKWESVLLHAFDGARNRSLKLGREFNIDYDFVHDLYEKQDGKCFYSNLFMETSGSNVMSIDRVDSSGGYTKDNVVLCCHAANIMKNSRNAEAFINFCGSVWNNRKQT